VAGSIQTGKANMYSLSLLDRNVAKPNHLKYCSEIPPILLSLAVENCRKTRPYNYDIPAFPKWDSHSKRIIFIKTVKRILKKPSSYL
jgi:hypothetical protein